MNLNDALKECKIAAKDGESMARGNYDDLKNSLIKASREIDSCIRRISNSNMKVKDEQETLKKQLKEIKKKMEDLQSNVKKDIELRSNNLSKFSITLFGRTMAGKSTLMEILRNGDGKTIGTGAQRTTRSVRTYLWKDLSITDVPGIAAFEGKEDEDLAFESANKADLILFLITDDAPQPAEADCLARIRSLGKPVLGIINVKSAVDLNKSTKLVLRNILKRFDNARLNDLISQFYSFSKQYGQNWTNIQFIQTHLKAAFLAKKNPDVAFARELEQISRFSEVTDNIIKVVITKGTFFRVKSFIDATYKITMDISNEVLKQNEQNYANSKLIQQKRLQLMNWKDDFNAKGISEIDNFLSFLKNDLENEANTFAENNYDNENASDEWNKLIREKKIDEQVENLLKRLHHNVNREIQKISRQLQNQLKYQNITFTDRVINVKSITDWKKLWRWGTNIVSCILYLIPGGGALASGVAKFLGWLGSKFFDSKEEKTQKARVKLEQQLQKHINQIISHLRREIKTAFEHKIVNEIDRVSNNLNEIATMLDKLSKVQEKLAWGLNSNLRKMNEQLVKEALKRVNKTHTVKLKKVARIPDGVVVVEVDKGTVVTKELKKDLKNLMQEKIVFIATGQNEESIIAQALNCKLELLKRDEDRRIIHLGNIKITPQIEKGTLLAQQLTEYLIMR